MDINQYFNRIKYNGDKKVSLENLTNLHKCHLFCVPFEDLDIHNNTPIRLNIESIFKKVIIKKRGGYCYELNYLFHELLTSLGFNVKMVSSQIYNKKYGLGPEFDHLCLIVEIDEEWLIDVGYGDLFIEPIKLKEGFIKKDMFKHYKINKENHSFLLSESLDGVNFNKVYLINTKSRSIEEFHEECKLTQHSKDSHFVKNRICTLPTNNGRLTLFNDTFKIRINESKTEQQIHSNEEFEKILKENFNIVL